MSLPNKSRKETVSKMKTYYRILFGAMIFYGSLLIFGGCACYEPMPDIVESQRIEPKVVTPKAAKPKPQPKQKTVRMAFPRDWLPSADVEKKWTAVIIHHSATETGNAAIFDRMHREENHWDGVGYDFVIGNGTNSGDGQIEVTFRWRRQIPGAHCGGTPDNWANKDAVGICLVGNFDYREPTEKQMQSLTKLIRFLQNRYGISADRIYGHGETPGARVTDCPGRMFPLDRIKWLASS
jgi:N-acetylmuramoyl-L-alanine amidase